MSDKFDKKGDVYPYTGHDRGVVVTQPRCGEFEERPMTGAEMHARDPALKIAKDIYRHANQAGVCYYEFWDLIAKAIQGALDDFQSISDLDIDPVATPSAERERLKLQCTGCGVQYDIGASHQCYALPSSALRTNSELVRSTSGGPTTERRVVSSLDVTAGETAIALDVARVLDGLAAHICAGETLNYEAARIVTGAARMIEELVKSTESAIRDTKEGGA